MISPPAARAMSSRGASSVSSERVMGHPMWLKAGISYRLYARAYARIAGLEGSGERVPRYGRHAPGPAFRQPLLAGTYPPALRRARRHLQAGSPGGAHAALPGGGGDLGLVLPGLLVPGVGDGRGGAEA